MVKGDPKNWKEAIFKFLFNTKNPSRTRIFYFSIIGIIVFIIGTIAGIFIGHYFTKAFLDKPGVYISFGSINKDEIGYFIPIKVINSGQKTLHDVDLKVKTCYMDKFNEQYYDEITINNHENYQLRDLHTFEEIQKKWCYPDINFSHSNCIVELYILNSSHIYAPPQNCSVYICDLCPVESIVNSSEIEDSLNFSSTLYSPRRIELTIEPDEVYDVNISELETFSSVGLNFFSGREICVFEGNCSTSRMMDSSIFYHLPNLPVELKLTPKEYNSINITVNYADLVKILFDELKLGRVNVTVVCKNDNEERCPQDFNPEDFIGKKLILTET